MHRNLVHSFYVSAEHYTNTSHETCILSSTTTICLQQLKSTFDERKLAEIKVLKNNYFPKFLTAKKKVTFFYISKFYISYYSTNENGFICHSYDLQLKRFRTQSISTLNG